MLHVRHATIDDLDTVTRFSLALALESEGLELDPVTVRAGVQTLLGGAHGFTLVAEIDGRLVGMIMIGGKEWSDWFNGLFWWTTGMYVSVEARRTGVIRALYARVRELARQSIPQVVGLRGYVQATNELAQVVQKRIGRCNSGYLVFEERFQVTSKTDGEGAD